MKVRIVIRLMRFPNQDQSGVEVPAPLYPSVRGSPSTEGRAWRVRRDLGPLGRVALKKMRHGPSRGRPHFGGQGVSVGRE